MDKQNPIKIAVVQFPGSNTERETCLALRRTGMEPVEFLWNQPRSFLEACDGFIIVGGFSYEDRSRSGVIASLDPVLQVIKIQAEHGKPVLGICNGAQILVESGLVPGLEGNRLGMALTRNKRVRGSRVLGTGYYNAWSNLKMTVPPERCAFTRHLQPGNWIRVPLAHGEGRFLVPPALLEELEARQQTVFRYCDTGGEVRPEFPINPNGSVANLAAVCNPNGNIMAIMPHPERTPNGDPLFTSMREYIIEQPPRQSSPLVYKPPPWETHPFRASANSFELVTNLIITDNEAASVSNTLAQRGLTLSVTRQTHWEVIIEGNPDLALREKLLDSGELYNPNKEILVTSENSGRTRRFLVRPMEDWIGLQKRDCLRHRFGLKNLREIRHGVLWNLTPPPGEADSLVRQALDTHLFFNPYAHHCYAYE